MPKIITSISLFVFFAVLVSLLTAGLIYNQNSKAPIAVQPLNSTSTIPVASSTSAQTKATTTVTTVTKPAVTNNIQTVTLNQAEISKHNSTGSCWLIINSQVYDVTSYLTAHPGGVRAIASYCGKDATTAFNTMGRNGHSSYANELLNQYLVGRLNQVINQ